MNGLLARFDQARPGAHRGRGDRPDALPDRAQGRDRRRPRQPARRRVLLLAGRGLGGGNGVPRSPDRATTAHPYPGSGSPSATGRIDEASAENGEAELLAALDIDEGARFLGELGIGCNTGITQPMRNIARSTRRWRARSTSRSAASYTSVGGKNESALHWDLVKDLRNGGRIELDGEVVQENGTWLV